MTVITGTQSRSNIQDECASVSEQDNLEFQECTSGASSEAPAGRVNEQASVRTSLLRDVDAVSVRAGLPFHPQDETASSLADRRKRSRVLVDDGSLHRAATDRIIVGKVVIVCRKVVEVGPKKISCVYHVRIEIWDLVEKSSKNRRFWSSKNRPKTDGFGSPPGGGFWGLPESPQIPDSQIWEIREIAVFVKTVKNGKNGIYRTRLLRYSGLPPKTPKTAKWRKCRNPESRFAVPNWRIIKYRPGVHPGAAPQRSQPQGWFLTAGIRAVASP